MKGGRGGEEKVEGRERRGEKKKIGEEEKKEEKVRERRKQMGTVIHSNLWYIFSSMVPEVRRRYIVTGLVCPMRHALSRA